MQLQKHSCRAPAAPAGPGSRPWPSQWMRQLRCSHSSSSSSSRRRGVACTAEQQPQQAAVSPFTKPQAAAKPASPATQPAAAADAGYTSHTWTWQGHSIHYKTAGCGRPVVLVHGFGASSLHYRKTLPWLAANGFKVYALDLLGFGASAKPTLNYTIQLWAELLRDFLAEHASGRPAVLVGNSIGSLSCLAAAAQAPAGTLAGLVLLNSAGAMNNKGVVSDWRIILAWPLLLLIDLLLQTPPIAAALFNALAQRETVAKVLRGVYVDEAAVDDELVDIILAPAFTDNALHVFVSVITGADPGPKPWDLVPKLSSQDAQQQEQQLPLFVAWGDADPFTPLDGPVGKYFAGLADSRPATTFALLPGVGHCPQDDRPEALHAQLLPWLQQLPA